MNNTTTVRSSFIDRRKEQSKKQGSLVTRIIILMIVMLIYYLTRAIVVMVIACMIGLILSLRMNTKRAKNGATNSVPNIQPIDVEISFGETTCTASSLTDQRDFYYEAIQQFQLRKEGLHVTKIKLDISDGEKQFISGPYTDEDISAIIRLAQDKGIHVSYCNRLRPEFEALGTDNKTIFVPGEDDLDKANRSNFG